MSRVKTFDSTGVAPGGVLYAGDLNNIQDHCADQTNLSQTVSVGTLVVGAAGLAISQYATGVMRISGQLRVDSVVNSVTGYQVNGTPLSSAHLSDTLTGTGALVKANSPALTGIPTAPTATPGDTSTQIANMAALAAAVTAVGGGSGSIPSGAVIPYAGTTVPSGWLMCDGAAVLRSTYSALFAAISTAYGAGDGTTTFNVPDMRGRIPVGKNTGTFAALGATGGEETHTLAVTEIPAHAHSMTAISAGTPSGTVVAASAGTPSGTIPSGGAHTHTVTTFSGTGNGTIASGGVTVDSPNTTPSGGAHTHTFVGTAMGTHGHTFTGTALPTHAHTINNTGGGFAHNNVQPYVVTNYLIKT